MALLVFVFVLSGAAGLIYETVWARYLGLLVGHSAYAQVVVLVIFLGGMAIGSALVSRRSSRIQRPLIAYAIVELVIGVIGAGFHSIFTWTSAVAYESWFPALGYGGALVVTKWCLAAALILPQSLLLGATFPLMVAGALRLGIAGADYALGLLYFANSMGAAVGVLIEGFVLIDAVGLHGTLLAAAALNVIAAAVVVARKPVVLSTSPVALSEAKDLHLRAGGTMQVLRFAQDDRLLLMVSAFTALSSFFYEIGWTRMLSLVLGSATHSFELMLSAFIFGLALGAYWIRRRAVVAERPLRLLGQIQWAMGLLALATIPVYALSFHVMATVVDGLPHDDRGYLAFAAIRYAMALAVMLPATFCAGMTLPLITAMLVKSGMGERAIGMVYSVNTWGSIAGVAIAALVLMPLIGLRWLLIAGASIDIVLGIWLVSRDRRAEPSRPAIRTRRFLPPQASLTQAIALTVGFVVATALLFPFNRSVLASGVYRHGIVASPNAFHFLYYRDGRTATVSLRRPADDTSGFITLATNGKPDASMAAEWRRPVDTTAQRIGLDEDMSTQLLVPIIGMAHRPDARLVAVVGQGSGMTSHVLLGNLATDRVVTIEIEPEMVRASRGFYPANHRVFSDRRSVFVIDDARSYLSASGRTFDLIVSEPSNPWVSGVSGLFTVEFYRRVRAHLAAGGVLAQWLHLYEINDDLVASVLASIDAVFPSYDVYMTSNSDILIVAVKDSTVPRPDWAVTSSPGLARDLRRVVPILPEQLEAMRIAGRSILHPALASGVALNSDFHPVLDLGTERSRFVHSYATGIRRLGESRFDAAAAIDGRTRTFGTGLQSSATEIARVNALALGAALRAARAGDPAADFVREDSAVAAAITRDAVFSRFTSGRVAPTDWPEWVKEFLAVEAARHGGTAGIADEAFYSSTTSFLDRVVAPEAPKQAVRFAHGLAAWRFDEAVTAGDWLITERAARGTDSTEVEWFPLEALHQGAVMAHLLINDHAGARRAYDALLRFRAGELTLYDKAIEALIR